ncbi:hypothetical protein P280DRAFT_480109 [Massarina eburnea CBS 473.64]|uniref:Uncharacterized protein n=1 Tax=Massarina eburnea CBS 473.64 TaxID=1395130 RepID=A0A6A6S1N0_9PLEO|nr:hypothetical protein P280DRAFT_480109 [Massarina eburnea CBS 473.64]
MKAQNPRPTQAAVASQPSFGVRPSPIQPESDKGMSADGIDRHPPHSSTIIRPIRTSTPPISIQQTPQVRTIRRVGSMVSLPQLRDGASAAHPPRSVPRRKPVPAPASSAHLNVRDDELALNNSAPIKKRRHRRSLAVSLPGTASNAALLPARPSAEAGSVGHCESSRDERPRHFSFNRFMGASIRSLKLKMQNSVSIPPKPRRSSRVRFSQEIEYALPPSPSSSTSSQSRPMITLPDRNHDREESSVIRLPPPTDAVEPFVQQQEADLDMHIRMAHEHRLLNDMRHKGELERRRIEKEKARKEMAPGKKGLFPRLFTRKKALPDLQKRYIEDISRPGDRHSSSESG